MAKTAEDDDANDQRPLTQHVIHIYPPTRQHQHQQPSLPKRRQVKSACTNCRKVCKKCDDARPCFRCVKYGISDDCVDAQRKKRQGVKRGPYKQKGKIVDQDNTQAPVPSSSNSASDVQHPPADHLSGIWPPFYSPQGFYMSPDVAQHRPELFQACVPITQPYFPATQFQPAFHPVHGTACLPQAYSTADFPTVPAHPGSAHINRTTLMGDQL